MFCLVKLNGFAQPGPLRAAYPSQRCRHGSVRPQAETSRHDRAQKVARLGIQLLPYSKLSMGLIMDNGKAIAWTLRVATTAGIGLLISMAWSISQEMEIQNVRIENNRRNIEQIVEVLLLNAEQETADED